jgi:hypothetical protein
MLKKLALFFACIILFSVSLITMNGCAKQKAQEEPAAEQMEEAAPDTAEVMEEEAE